MNWGVKIVIGLGIAMTSIVATGIYMVSQDNDSLEDIHYYEKGLNYDSDYERVENTNRHHAKPTFQLSKDTLLISFTGKTNVGTLLLKRPSDNRLDEQHDISTSGSQYALPLAHLQTGAWKLRLEWIHEGRRYLEEKDIYKP